MSSKIPFVALSKQFDFLKKDLINSFNKVGKSGNYILGKEVNLFEKRFAKLCNTKFAVGVGNGSDAIVFALKSCGVKQGDEVIIPANSFIATAWAVVACNAKPVYADICDDLNIDPLKIENKISKKTKAIIAVHYTGRIAKMKQILNIARKYNLDVIEDSAQAIGAKYYNKIAGSFGDCGCFSFHPLKNLGLYGDGGAISLNNKKKYNIINLLRNHGLIDRDLCKIWGYNSRLDEIQASFANIKLRYLNRWTMKHRSIASIYSKNLTSKVITPTEYSYEQPVYHNYIILVNEREKLQEFLNSNNIETKIHYPIPLHLQPVSRKLGYKKGDMPKTEFLSKKILSLPIYPELKDIQISRIIDKINHFFKQ
tara:strand:+ start:2975 stop:4078 length:1104 start_codon:yes stop_codon:yes gene_type:complete